PPSGGSELLDQFGTVENHVDRSRRADGTGGLYRSETALAHVLPVDRTLENLSGRSARVFRCHMVDACGLVRGDLLGHPRLHPGHVEFATFAQDDHRGDLLSESFVGDADDGGFEDVRMTVEDLFEFFRVDV